MNYSELVFRIALKSAPSVGAVTLRNLISYCGSAEAVFASSRRQLLRVPGVGTGIADTIMARHQLLEGAAREVELMRKHGVRAIFYLDADYPERLNHIHNSPALLYMRGSASLNARRMVAVIGTRRPTTMGRTSCAALVEGLAKYDVTLVSGLAYGIDIEAHRRALEFGCPTIGVLGSGLGNIYPSSHADVARQMMGNGGLLTEFNFEVKPEKDNFPARNRIIAGMCDVVVVVESGKTGGSMITAEFANDFNRDVGAVPGRITDVMSSGTNLLIKRHKAHLVESADDIARLMGWDSGPSSNIPVQKKIFHDLSERERQVLGIIEKEDMHIDLLARQTGIPIGELAAVLLSLECGGYVESVPGKKYHALNTQA